MVTKRRVTRQNTKPVELSDVLETARRMALDAADGDETRITVISKTTVIVHNPKTGK